MPPQHNSLTFPTTKRHTSPLLFSMSLPKMGRIELGLEKSMIAAIKQERIKTHCLRFKKHNNVKTNKGAKCIGDTI